MKSLYFHYIEGGCHYHRALQPARFCHADLPGCAVTSGPSPGGDEYDAYAAHGLLDFSSYQRVGRWHSAGRKFVWSVDDDWLSVPDWNPAKPPKDDLDSYYVARGLADLILCSTRALADTFPGRPTAVAPNLLDLTRYPPAGHPSDDGPVRILWGGSITHRGDVALVVPAVDRVIRRFGPHRVQVVFLGEPPPAALARDHLHRGLLWQPMVPFHRYWEALAGIRAHVVLAPLVDCPFNHAKSNLRVLEAWALTAAVVASPVGEYRVIRPGVDGLAAAGTAAWEECVAHLVENAQARRSLAEAGRRRVEREWNWANWECRRPWHRAIAAALGVPVPESPPVLESAA